MTNEEVELRARIGELALRNARLVMKVEETGRCWDRQAEAAVEDDRDEDVSAGGRSGPDRVGVLRVEGHRLGATTEAVRPDLLPR